MTSKEAKTHIIDTLNGDMNKEYFINELLPEILKDLERLEEIENLRTTPKALETCLANYMNKCIGLQKENQELKEENNKLKKALKIIMKWRKSQMYDLMQNLEDQNIEGFETLEEVLCNES